MTTMFGNNAHNSIFEILKDDPSLSPVVQKVIDILVKYKHEIKNRNGTENRSEDCEIFEPHCTDDLDTPEYSNAWMNKPTAENIDFRCPAAENIGFKSPIPIECNEKLPFYSLPQKESKKMFAFHPLEGCICEVCSFLKKRFRLSYDRKGPCIPAGSVVLLKENILGTYQYFGHRKELENGMISDQYCLDRREVGHNICLFNPEGTEIMFHCDAIKAVYIKSEKKRHQKMASLSIPRFSPPPSEHVNLYSREKSCRSNSLGDFSGNRHPVYYGHKRYSGYSDLSNHNFCDSPNPVFGESTRNGSGHYVFNSIFSTDV